MSNRVSVVFAGGGCRTFWALGVLDALRDSLGDIREWAGVSAGGAMAVLSAAECSVPIRKIFADLTRDNRRNINLACIFPNQALFPHERMYRLALNSIWTQRALDRLKGAGEVRLLLASVTPGYRPLTTALKALRRYNRRKRAGVLHGPEIVSKGIEMQVVAAQDAMGPEQLTDWIVCSSATAPLMPSPPSMIHTYLDGGLIDNVPVRALSTMGRTGPVLVLLNRPMPQGSVFEYQDRLYVAPSQEVAIKKWDYTAPGRMEATWLDGFEVGESTRFHVLDYLARKGVASSRA